MHLGLTNLIRGLFTFGGPKPKKSESTDHSYEYIRGPISSRGPCPGLNALANQGYLPRDGKNITLAQVQDALKTALHMSTPLATSLTNSLKPLLAKDGTFSLVDMRRHNVLEHDVSFTRLDFHQSSDGDNYTFQPAMFDALLADAGGGDVTVKSLAKTYARRKKESRAAGSPRLPLKLWFVNVLQTVSLLNTAQTGGKLSRELMTTFYTEERFPDIILENEKTRTLLGLVGHGVVLLWHVVFK
jgi:hypothetical protein